MGRATRWLKALFGIQSKEKDTTNEHSVTSKDKNRWSSGHRGWDGAVLCNNSATIPPNITPAEAEWLRAFYSEPDSEQKQQARAMAAATAAAADAAVAAAQAAQAAVRFTSQGGGTVMFGGRRERGAAVKIQSLFRGYLARKALRALKGLVKIQALVRGFLVRKQAAATLYSIEALIRAQASVRAMKTRRFINYDESYPQFEARKSLDKFDEHALHTRMPCASFEAGTTALDESPKIVEVDTGCRPRSRLRTSNACTRSSDSYDNSISSPLSCRIPARLSMPEPDSHGLSEQELAHFSTPQSTPRFGSSCKCTTATATPAKSESYFSSYAQHPNYMNKTQSFKAKLRSQSAPKQRPDPGPARRNSMRSGLQDREAISFKNAIVGKLGSSSNFVRGNLEF